METSNLKKSKITIALWVVTGVLAIACGVYALFLQNRPNLSVQEKPVTQSQTTPEIRNDSNTLNDRGPDGPSSEQHIPPDGTQAPVMGGHNMGVPPDAPPLKDAKPL